MNKEEDDWLTCKKRLLGGHGKVHHTVMNGNKECCCQLDHKPGSGKIVLAVLNTLSQFR